MTLLKNSLLLLLLSFFSFTSHAALSDHFVTTWKTDNPGSSNDTSITFLINHSYTYLYDVDWDNDGVFDEFGLTGDVAHDFGTSGVKTIRIKGNFPYMRLNYDSKKIISIDQWGSVQWQSMERSFTGAENLILKAQDAPNLSNCTSLEWMFAGATQVGAETENANWQWDTSNITIMRTMFDGASSFNQDIGGWNTSSVRWAHNMFHRAFSFNQDVGSWNTGQFIDMGGMFEFATSFNQDISNWDTSNVISMASMFKNAFSFNQNIGGWTTDGVTSMESMFEYASKFNQDISNWNTSNVTNMNNMFRSDKLFNQDIGIWNTSAVISMSGMFLYATSFNQDLSNWNVENVTSFFGMFGGAKLSVANYDALLVAWNEQNLSLNANFSGGDSIYCSSAAQIAHNNMVSTFNWTIEDGGVCENSLNILSEYFVVDENTFDTSPIEYSDPDSDSATFTISGGDDMGLFTINFSTGVLSFVNLPDFENPQDANGDNVYLVEVTATDNGSSIESDTKLFKIYINNINENLSSEHFVVTVDASEVELVARKYYLDYFYYNYNIDWDNDGIFDEFNVRGNITHSFMSEGIHTIRISGEFPAMVIFNKRSLISVDQWGSNQWEYMYEMFSGTPNLVIKAQDVPNLFQVTSLSRMFYASLSVGNSLDTGNWNWQTPTIKSMSEMFYAAFSFNKDISSWDTSRVTHMGKMFSRAALFNQDLSAWNVENVNFFQEMFHDAKLSIANYDALLIAWNAQNLSINKEFDGGDSIYCSSAAQIAHDNMVSTFNWTIEDGGICENYLNILSEYFVVDENTFDTSPIEYSDPDFDSATFTISGGDDMDLFTINLSTGVISFINPPNFESPHDANGDNVYLVEVTATDNGSPIEFDTQLIKIYINNIYENLISEHFVSTWNTDSITFDDTVVYNYDYNVDWDNDGIFDDFHIKESISHIYPVSGLHTIRISGDFPSLFCDDISSIVSVDQWGSNQWKYMKDMFLQANNLVINAQDTPNLYEVTSLDGLFSRATSIGTSISTANWDWQTPTIRSMNFLFNQTYSFNKDISKWNTGNVRSMQAMFFWASSFNQDISIWNTSKVKNMAWIFKRAITFNQNINNWDTSKVQYMTGMFEDAISFDQDIGGWNIESVNDFSDMFKNKRLSVVNYDALLVGWNAQNLPMSKSFDGGDSIYCSTAAQVAHNNMTSFFNWTISDGAVCAPQLNIVSSNQVSVEENHTTVIKILTTDPDFDTPTFNISGGADGALFSIDASTGLLSFINPPDFENPQSMSNTNDYEVEISVLDDGIPQEFTSQLLTISVLDLVETSPVDLRLDATINTQYINFGDTVVFTLTVVNNGSQDAVNAILYDVLPAGFDNSTWTCVATGLATCTPSGTGEIADFITVPNDGSTLTYTITASLSASQPVSASYKAMIETSEPQYDTNLLDNRDEVSINYLVFTDGFE